MAEKQVKTKVELRRDLKANFDPNFLPLKGEVLFVDQPNGKVRIKVGNGITPYSTLAYLDEENNIVVWGYYLNGKFYTSSSYSEELEESEEHIYLDRNSDKVYIYDKAKLKFVCIDEMIPNATAERAGVMKLYNNQGQNTDGTITQKFFTDSIDDILFGLDDQDSECLVLEKPW